MSPVVHGLIAWLFAVWVLKETNDRRLAVIAGVAMDIDGIFILFNMDLFITYHHTFGHSYIFGIPLAVTAALLGREKLKIFFAALGAFTLHLLAVIIGSNWLIYPLYPNTDIYYSISPTVSNLIIYGVINTIVFLVCIGLMLIVMYYKQISPIEFISEKWDERFVSTYVYYFKYKCEICGKRAFTFCSLCGKKVCNEHLKSFINWKCTECSKY
jgi:hypothetical protein